MSQTENPTENTPVVCVAWGSRKRHIFFDKKILCETEHKSGYSKGGHYNSYDLDWSCFEKKHGGDTFCTHTYGVIDFKPLEQQGIITKSICKKCLKKYAKELERVTNKPLTPNQP